MRVLITGAAGQLGRALQRTAPPHAAITAIDVEDCDLTDLPTLRARLTVEAPEVIINAAAYTAVDRAESDAQAARAINVDAVGAMVEAVAQTGGRLVHVSTDFVFDGAATRPYRPTDPRNPLSVYGRTKAEGEDLLRPADLLVRTSWVYEVGRRQLRAHHDPPDARARRAGSGCRSVGAPPPGRGGLPAPSGPCSTSAPAGSFIIATKASAAGTNLPLPSPRRPMRWGLIPAIPQLRADHHGGISHAGAPAGLSRCSIAPPPAPCSVMRAVPGATNLRLMLEEEARGG
ncbi:MAG: hypothetical protein KatS3mg120_0962 [Erythrobacter sp.]|nr:MAG: hypothetical protein KatS3mg120_0962 [Erythrobacter sp.]